VRASATPWERWLIPGLLVYFALQVLIRLTGSPVLELDEAEQVVVTQWWVAGYSGQPPLYAWVQKLAFEILGVNLLALSLVKNALLFLTYLFVYLSARRLLPDARLAVLATLSLLLIPQVAWESQRDLTHSVMVTTVTAAGFYVLLRWLNRPTVVHYLLLGLLFGLGLLSKYNYTLFAAAVLCALLTLPRGRALLFSPRILLSLVMAALVLAPHAAWFLGTGQLGSRSLEKLDFGGGLWPLSGFASLTLAVLAFLTPLWIVLLAVFRRDFLAALAGRGGHAEATVFPLGRHLLAVLLLLAAMVLLLDAAHFKDRWMLPLLLFFPLYVFAGLPPGALTPARLRAFASLCLVVPVLALLVMAGRVHEWPVPAGQYGHSYPFEFMTAEIRRSGFRKGLIVGDRAFIAGNLRFRFQQSWAVIPSVTSAGLRCGPDDDLLVVWDAARNAEPPAILREWLSAELGLDVAGAAYRVLRADAEGAALGVILIPASTAPLEARC
jgi:lipopolysaccharide core galacturonosyltransferase RgtB